MTEKIVLQHHDDIVEGTGIKKHWELDEFISTAYSDIEETVNIKSGKCLYIYDTTNVDYLHLCHDGTNATYETNAGVHSFNTDIVIEGGGDLKVYDSTDTDYLELAHDGSNATITTNAGNVWIQDNLVVKAGNTFYVQSSDNSEQFTVLHNGSATRFADSTGVIQCEDDFRVLGGEHLRVYDSGNTDYIQAVHNGTDAIINTNAGAVKFTNTITPNGADTYDCGSSGNYWQDMYTQDIYVNYIYDRSGGVTYMGNSVRPSTNNSFSLGISGGTTLAWAAVHSYNYTTVTSPFQTYSEDKSLEIVRAFEPKEIKEDGIAECDENTYPDEMAHIEEVEGKPKHVGKSLNKQIDILIMAVKKLDKRINNLEDNFAQKTINL